MKRTILLVLSVLFVLTAEAGSPKKLYVFTYKQTDFNHNNGSTTTEVLSHLKGKKMYLAYDAAEDVYYKADEKGNVFKDNDLLYNWEIDCYHGLFVWLMVADLVYFFPEYGDLWVCPVVDDDDFAKHIYMLSDILTVNNPRY